MNSTRWAREGSSSTTDAWAIPIDASSSSGFTIRGNRSSDGRTSLSPSWNSANAGTRMPGYVRIFLVGDVLRSIGSADGDEPVDVEPERAGRRRIVHLGPRVWRDPAHPVDTGVR